MASRGTVKQNDVEMFWCGRNDSLLISYDRQYAMLIENENKIIDTYSFVTANYNEMYQKFRIGWGFYGFPPRLFKLMNERREKDATII